MATPVVGGRPPVAIAAIRLLQRRNESLLVGRLAQLLQDDLPEPVWEVTLYTLGSIGAETSITLLLECWLACCRTPKAVELLHQLEAQFCHQHLLRQRVKVLLQEGKITAEEEAPLLARSEKSPETIGS